MKETDLELIRQIAKEIYFSYEDEKAIIKGDKYYKGNGKIVLEEFYIRCLWLIEDQGEKTEIKLLEDIFIQWEYFCYFGGDGNYCEEMIKITRDLFAKALGQFGDEIKDADGFRNIIMGIQSDYGEVLNKRIQKRETKYHEKNLGNGAMNKKIDDYIGWVYTICDGVMYDDDQKLE